MIARRFRRDFGALQEIYAFNREFLRAQGLDEETAYDLDLIAEELFTNMVKYARGGRGEVAIELGWAAPVLTLRLHDFDVEPYDITKTAPVDTSRPLMERRAGGLGLHLVRRIADRVEYAYRDRNSTVTVTKRLES